MCGDTAVYLFLFSFAQRCAGSCRDCLFMMLRCSVIDFLYSEESPPSLAFDPIDQAYRLQLRLALSDRTLSRCLTLFSSAESDHISVKTIF
ncbi:hypothetical protein HZ326_6687 [Fusarium oxysporum f. sp. albedinis]|nr:hypothetical protein HZ326_6687 [Fusarium oxysporum f. sp. albedinis]